MKVIFLDIDGVMNSVADRFSFTIETDLHFHILKLIVDATGAKIVLSSSWRKSLYDFVNNRLKQFGMELLDRTPVFHRPYVQRGEEIRYWLEHTESHVDRFVILDDEGDMCEYKHTHLVKTNPLIGLRTPWAVEAIKILNGELGSYEADRYNDFTL